MLKYILLLALASVAIANEIASANDLTMYPCPTYGYNRLPHSTSCSHFVQCMSGWPIVQSCAQGFYYSTEIEECTYPHLANCTVNEGPCPLFNNPGDLTFVPDANSCDTFFLCYSNQLIEHRCAQGLHWDPVNNQCNYPFYANCQATGVNCDAPGIYNVAHPFLCNQFFTCIDGDRFPQNCVSNFYFDVVSSTCVRPELATCFTTDPQPPTTTVEPTPIIEGENLE